MFILCKFNKKLENKNKIFLSRRMLILPCFCSKTVYIHNGCDLKKLVVVPSMFFKVAGTLVFSKKKQNFKKEKKKNK